MQPATEEELNELIQQGISLLAGIQEKFDGSRDIVKMRINFWEKLVVLNAGTLALTFTGAANFRAHMLGDGGVGFLLAAWKLLFLSIGSALLAQHLANTAISGNQIKLEASLFKHKLDMWVAEMNKRGVNFEPPSDLSQKLIKMMNGDHSKSERVSLWLGTLAELLTVGSYVWIFLFARVNLRF